MARRRLLAIVVAAMVLASGGGWLAGSRIRSPAQVAADREPPEASLVTAEVQRRSLSSTVVSRGTVRYGEPKEVSLPASPSADSTATVTRPASKGATLAEGDVALEVSGRPTIALTGGVPMYRDIGPGDRGDDVRQLEEALARLGFRPGEVDGTYDAATEGAVDAWYRAVGYDARGPSDAERSELRSARDATTSAEERLLQAQTSLETAEQSAQGADLEESAARARAAHRALDDAERSADLALDRIDVAKAAEKVAVANVDIASAKVDLAKANLTIARSSERTTRSRDDLAERALATANANRLRDDARARAAVIAAYGRLSVAQVVLNDLEARDSDADATNDPSDSELQSARTAVADATNDVSTAELDERATKLAGEEALAAAELAVEAAEDATLAADAATTQAAIAVDEARAAVMSATAARLAAAVDAKDASSTSAKAAGTVAAARDDLVVADARLAQLQDPQNLDTLREGVAGAERALGDARAALAELEGETGIIVPANELVFFPTLPLRVDDVTADAGADATAPVMTVTTGRLAVDGALSVADARLVRRGDTVTVTSTDLGVEVTGVVTEIGTEPGTDGVESNQVYVEVTPEDAPPELTGASVRVAIAVESTDGDVLAVPVAAVSVAADGSSRVQVEDEPGTTRWVTVTPGLAADGLVEVDGDLDEGDRVVVGE